jgi:hypothetical protein
MQLVFGRDAILNVKHTSDWEHIRQRKQTRNTDNSRCENQSRRAHQCSIGDKMSRNLTAMNMKDCFSNPCSVQQFQFLQCFRITAFDPQDGALPITHWGGGTSKQFRVAPWSSSLFSLNLPTLLLHDRTGGDGEWNYTDQGLNRVATQISR